MVCAVGAGSVTYAAKSGKTEALWGVFCACAYASIACITFPFSIWLLNRALRHAGITALVVFRNAGSPLCSSKKLFWYAADASTESARHAVATRALFLCTASPCTSKLPVSTSCAFSVIGRTHAPKLIPGRSFMIASATR